MPENIADGAVDLGIAPSAALIGSWPRVADARQHEPVFDPVGRVSVPCEPCDRADCPWDEEEPVGVTERAAAQVLRQTASYGDPGEIVVARAKGGTRGRR